MNALANWERRGDGPSGVGVCERHSMGALGHWHQTMILSTASSRRQSTRSSASRRKVARPASQRSGWPGELAGLLRSLKATLKLGPGNTKLVAGALRHGLGSWPELASSGDGARAGASRECGRPFAAPQSGAAERHCHSPAIPPIRTRRRFGDAAPRRVGCRQCRTCPGHARARFQRSRRTPRPLPTRTDSPSRKPRQFYPGNRRGLAARVLCVSREAPPRGHLPTAEIRGRGGHGF